MTTLEALKANNWIASVEGIAATVKVAGVIQVKRGDRVADCALLRDHPSYSINELVVVDGKPVITCYAMGITVPNGYASPEQQIAALERATYVLSRPELKLLAVA